MRCRNFPACNLPDFQFIGIVFSCFPRTNPYAMRTKKDSMTDKDFLTNVRHLDKQRGLQL
jgi:hypothetical protein